MLSPITTGVVAGCSAVFLVLVHKVWDKNRLNIWAFRKRRMVRMIRRNMRCGRMRSENEELG